MAQITNTLVVAGLILVAATSVGASAFTAATVERQADANVVADEDGLLALIDGNSGNLVYQDAEDEQLVIDFTSGTASGANTDALFELGDPDNPGASQAFQVKNNDAEAHQITAAYTPDSDDSNSAANIEFRIYDGDGELVGAVNEEGDIVTMDADAAELYDVVIVVDTGHDGADTVTSEVDLSGTLAFTVDGAEADAEANDD